MRKIITKLSASIILILMLFSTSFNLISYAVDNTQQMEITSGRFRLIVSKGIYDQYEGFLTTWLARYDNYYSILVNYTGQDPISRGLVGSDKIIIDTCNRNLSSAGREAETTGTSSGISIYYCNTRFDKLVETMNVDSATESAALIHELGHVFQYGSNPNTDSYEWCFEIETMAMVCANHIFENSSINRVVKVEPFGINVRPFTSVQSELSSAYTNTSYSNYAKSALKLIQIEHQVGSMSSVIRALNTREDYVFSNNANRFNEFIDTWEQQTGADIWGKFSDEDLETISSVVGGKVGSSEDTEDSILEITKFTAEQQDDKIKVNVTIRTNKEPSEVTAKIELEGKTIDLENGTKNGETISYTTDITLTKELKDKKELQISLDVTEEGGAIAADYTIVTLTQDEEKIIKSISAKDKIDLKNDTEIKLSIELYNKEKSYEVSISIGEEIIGSETITDSGIITIPIDENLKAYLEKQTTVRLTATIVDGEVVDGEDVKITIVKEGEAQISDITFTQEENSNTNEYDCKIENKKATLSMKIEGTEKIKQLIATQSTGFTQTTSTTEPNDEGKYEIELEYQELRKTDCVERDGKYYITCYITAVLEDGKPRLYGEQEVEILNLEEEDLNYEFSYQIGAEEKEINPIGKEETITLDKEQKILIIVKGGDTTGEKVTWGKNDNEFSKATYNHNGEYNQTEYSLKAAETGEGELNIKFNGTLVVTFKYTITEAQKISIPTSTPNPEKETLGEMKELPTYINLYRQDSPSTPESPIVKTDRALPSDRRRFANKWN